MMDQSVQLDNLKLVIEIAAFIAILIVIFFIYRLIFRYFRKKAAKTQGKLDDFILNLFKIPALWVFYWILLKIFGHLFLRTLNFYPYFLHINTLLFIFSVAWIAVQFTRAGAYYIQGKLDVGSADNLKARKSLTQLKVFKAIINAIIVIVAIAIGLMTFKEARTIGVSLLTSAGIAGIIVGLAAQKSIGMLLAGIQLAITQPIRLDDVVIVEGEWGRVEEITLTYVVVKIWDERRLILPVNYFLEHPFQNWTRVNSRIMGTLFLYADYSLPVDRIREALPGLLKDNPNWDGRVANVQVTNNTERYKEIRVLLSSADASKNWDLRVTIREKLIDFILENYPESLVKIRIHPVGQVPGTETDPGSISGPDKP